MYSDNFLIHNSFGVVIYFMQKSIFLPFSLQQVGMSMLQTTAAAVTVNSFVYTRYALVVVNLAGYFLFVSNNGNNNDYFLYRENVLNFVFCAAQTSVAIAYRKIVWGNQCVVQEAVVIVANGTAFTFPARSTTIADDNW